MPHTTFSRHQPARDATPEERQHLIRHLVEQEFGDMPLADEEQAVQNAVTEAVITVFPNTFRDGHLVMVIWPQEYPRLPNHPERFKLTRTGEIRLLPHTGRRKYNRH
jgi:hypothetical protein